MKRITLKLRKYQIVEEAVETGITRGVIRADKHANDPLTEAQIQRVAQVVHDYVMNQLCEVIDFDA